VATCLPLFVEFQTIVATCLRLLSGGARVLDQGGQKKVKRVPNSVLTALAMYESK